MSDFATTDSRLRKIGDQTWVGPHERYVFEVQQGGVNVFNLRKGPGQTPPLNEKPYATLDEAIIVHLGPLKPAQS